MIQFPKIKKTVTKFIKNEDGRISKHNLVKIGIIIFSAVPFATKIIRADHGSCSANSDHASISGHNSGEHNSATHKDEGIPGAHMDGTGHGSWIHGSCDWPGKSYRNYKELYAHNNNLLAQKTLTGMIKGTHAHSVLSEHGNVQILHSSSGDTQRCFTYSPNRQTSWDSCWS